MVKTGTFHLILCRKKALSILYNNLLHSMRCWFRRALVNARAGLEEQPEPGGNTSNGLQTLEFMQPAAALKPQDIEASTGRHTYHVYL